MDNNHALKLIVEYHRDIKEDQFYVVCDLDYTIIAEDGMSAQLANTPDQTFIGKKLIPEVSRDLWRTKQVEQIITRCIATGQSSEWLSLRFSRQQEYWLIQLKYNPLINVATGEVIGIKVVASPVKYPLYMYAIDSIINVSKQNMTKQITESTIPDLDSLEHEVLFLTYHADNYEDVMNWLSLAHGTVFSKSKISRINASLMQKFACNTIEELKEIVFQRELHLQFPYSLVGEFMYPVK